MSSHIEIALTIGLIVYLLVVLFMYFASSELEGPREDVDRASARLKLTAPIWPIWGLIGLWRLFTRTLPRLWKEADWKN